MRTNLFAVYLTPFQVLAVQETPVLEIPPHALSLPRHAAPIGGAGSAGSVGSTASGLSWHVVVDEEAPKKAAADSVQARREARERRARRHRDRVAALEVGVTLHVQCACSVCRVLCALLCGAGYTHEPPSSCVRSDPPLYACVYVLCRMQARSRRRQAAHDATGDSSDGGSVVRCRGHLLTGASCWAPISASAPLIPSHGCLVCGVISLHSLFLWLRLEALTLTSGTTAMCRLVAPPATAGTALVPLPTPPSEWRLERPRHV